MKGLGSGNKRLQHNIVGCSLTFELFQTDEAFTVNGCKHAHSHIRKQQVGKSGWERPGSHPEVFCKKSEFHREIPVSESFFNKVAGRQHY